PEEIDLSTKRSQFISISSVKWTSQTLLTWLDVLTTNLSTYGKYRRPAAEVYRKSLIFLIPRNWPPPRVPLPTVLYNGSPSVTALHRGLSTAMTGPTSSPETLDLARV